MTNKFLFAAIAVIFAIQMIMLGIVLNGDKKLGFQTADNATINGTLSVAGASTLSSTLAVTGTSSLTGDVGIATSTPASELDVYDASATSSIAIYSGTAGLGGWLILENDAGSGCFAIGITPTGNFTTTTVTCGSSQ